MEPATNHEGFSARGGNTGWVPPAETLPGPHAHLELIRCLGRSAGREIWSASSERWPDQLAIVELCQDTFPDAHCPDRFALDLRAWAGAGWPATALVTLLPAALPQPHAHFQLLSFIGVGGMGQVWMAESPDYPDIPLAIKFFTHPAYAQHPLLLEQCLEEARYGINIQCDSIAQTLRLLNLSSHQAEGWPAIGLVMRLHEPSLQRVLDDLRATDRHLPEDLAREFARHIYQALQTLHSRYGLVHRDVKPANILFRMPANQRYRGPDSLHGAQALLADLGTLCRIGERPFFALGQDGWKAPELFQPPGGSRPNTERPADPQEDWYAFGKVLQALTGRAEVSFHEPPPHTLQPRSAIESQGSPDAWDSVWNEVAPFAPQFPEPGTSPHVRDRDFHALVAGLINSEHDHRAAAVALLHEHLFASLGRPAGDALPDLPGYELIERIGEGGMGVVYKAKHRGLNRLVALKMIRAGLTASTDALARFRMEAEAIAHLQHPHIVQIHEVGERDGVPFLSLEFCAGGSLAKQITTGPLPPAEAVALLSPAARAIAYAHQRGIIHRDLKPGNILLTADGCPKIADFGLARVVDASTQWTQTGMILGTPAYMAPEQAGGGLVGPGTDVYGLGAVLYSLLTGKPPFTATSSHDLLHLVRQGAPTPPHRVCPEIPLDLEAICLRCLEKDPALRYRSAADLADDLDRYLKAEPVHARPAGLLARLWRRKRQRMTLALVCVSLSLLAVLAALWRAKGHPKKRDRDPSTAELRLTAAKAAHAETVSRARALAAHGNWAAALPAYQQAINDNQQDRRHLAVERLPGLLAFNHSPSSLAQEVAALSQLDNTSQDAALLLLWRGELTLAEPDPHGEQFIQQALRNPGQLPAADRAYAHALLASLGSPEQLDLLIEATLMDPFHQRAQRALALVHALRGENPTARRHVRFLRLHFPDDPLPDFIEALRSAKQGEFSATQQKLRELRQRLGENRTSSLLALLQAVLEKKPTSHRLIDPAIKDLGCGAFPLLSLRRAN